MADTTLMLMNRLNLQIGGILSALDIDLIGRQTTKTIAYMRQSMGDVRLDIRDWEMSENREEMLVNAEIAQKRIDELRSLILKASESGIFSTIDVVDLSSQLDTVEADLR